MYIPTLIGNNLNLNNCTTFVVSVGIRKTNFDFKVSSFANCRLTSQITKKRDRATFAKLTNTIKMIKYLIIKYESNGFGGKKAETKTINKSELNKHLNDKWIILEKTIPIITPVKKWWNKFTIDNKLLILSFSIPSLVAVFFGVLAHQTKEENDSLKFENKTLNDNYIQLKQTLTLTSDSLSIERENSESIKKQLQEIKVSDANLSDKKN